MKKVFLVSVASSQLNNVYDTILKMDVNAKFLQVNSSVFYVLTDKLGEWSLESIAGVATVYQSKYQTEANFPI